MQANDVVMTDSDISGRLVIEYSKYPVLKDVVGGGAFLDFIGAPENKEHFSRVSKCSDKDSLLISAVIAGC